MKKEKEAVQQERKALQEQFQAYKRGEWLLCPLDNPVTGQQHAVLLTPSQQEGTRAVSEPGVTSEPSGLLAMPAGVISLTVPLSKQTWQPALSMKQSMCSSQCNSVRNLANYPSCQSQAAVLPELFCGTNGTSIMYCSLSCCTTAGCEGSIRLLSECICQDV